MVNGECTSCGQKVRFAMFSCSFLRIIRQSIQVLCPVFSRKVFFRDANKVWTSKTSLCVGRQDFVQHGARVISAAKQPEILHVPLVATNCLISWRAGDWHYRIFADFVHVLFLIQNGGVTVICVPP